MNPFDLFPRMFGLDEERAPASAIDSPIDALEEAYVAWRNTCFAVDHAYAGWAASDAPEREFAFACYELTLQHEEHAASVYRSCVEHLT